MAVSVSLTGLLFQNIMYSYDQILSVLQFGVASILISPSVTWPVLHLSLSGMSVLFPPCTSSPACSHFLCTRGPASSACFPLLLQCDWLYVLEEDTQPSLFLLETVKIIFVVSQNVSCISTLVTNVPQGVLGKHCYLSCIIWKLLQVLGNIEFHTLYKSKRISDILFTFMDIYAFFISKVKYFSVKQWIMKFEVPVRLILSNKEVSTQVEVPWSVSVLPVSRLDKLPSISELERNNAGTCLTIHCYEPTLLCVSSLLLAAFNQSINVSWI